MDKTKEPNWFLRILGILFFVYISLTIAMQLGYYENKLQEKTTLTEENIKKFENDVKQGMPVDINDYVIKDVKDYSNGMSKTGASVSKFIENFMTDGIGKMFSMIKKLVT